MIETLVERGRRREIDRETDGERATQEHIYGDSQMMTEKNKENQKENIVRLKGHAGTKRKKQNREKELHILSEKPRHSCYSFRHTFCCS